MREILVATLFVASPSFSAASGQTASTPVTALLAAQNALFEEQYETGLKTSPERATAYGDYRYNDKLSEVSLAAIASREATNEGFLARLKAIPTDGFAEQDVLA